MAFRKRRKVFVRPMRNQGTKLTKNEEILLYFRLRPDLAAKYLLNIKLSWFQRITIRNVFRIPQCLLVWGRGTGKTFTVAVAAVLHAMLYPNIKVGVYGPVKRQGDYIFNEIEKLYRNSPFFQACTVGKVKRTMERNNVDFINGSILESMPLGDGSGVRGARYQVLFLDEFAQFDESVFNLVIRPFLAVQVGNRANKLILSSSAFFKWNHLWKYYKMYKVGEIYQPEEFYVSEYDFRDVLLDKNSPFTFDLNQVKQAREVMTTAEFKMEWMGEFPDDEDTFFPTILIEKCTPKPPLEDAIDIEMDCFIRDKDGNIEQRSTDQHVMGVDVGRAEGGANFAICICKYSPGDNIKTLSRIISKNGIRYQVMKDLIRQCTVDYNIVRIHCDKGGGGETIRDLLAEPWIDTRTGREYDPILDMEDEGTMNVQGLRYLKLINFQGNKHATLFSNLKSAMEHGLMYFPLQLRRHEVKDIEIAHREIQALKTELAVIKPKPIGASLRFEVPADFRKDRAVALTLAVDAAMELHIPQWQTKPRKDLAIGFFIDSGAY